MRIAFLCGLLLVSIARGGMPGEHPGEPSGRGLLKLFAETFHDGYRRDFCDENAFRLAARARRDGVLPTDAYWVTFERKAQCGTEPCRFRPLRPREPLGPRDPGWYYHSVLIARGRVYDFDFARKAVAVPIDRYLATMFDPETAADLLVTRLFDLRNDAFLVLDSRKNNRYWIPVMLGELAGSRAKTIARARRANRVLGTYGRYTQVCQTGPDAEPWWCRIVDRAQASGPIARTRPGA